MGAKAMAEGRHLPVNFRPSAFPWDFYIEGRMVISHSVKGQTQLVQVIKVAPFTCLISFTLYTLAECLHPVLLETALIS